MSDQTAYPLSWPIGWERTRFRENASRFKGNTFAKARDGLGHELDLLGAKNVVLSTNIPLRLDGQPRGGEADALRDPGVAVYFTLKGTALCMARDAYTKVSDNLRSLALAIEYMRGMRRHGGATMMDRAFAGFAALPYTAPATPWRHVFGFVADSVITLDQLEFHYRLLAKQRHPDMHSGSETLMIELNRAADDARRELGFT